MGDSMAALRKLAPEPGLHLEQVAVPTPGPGDVLVRVLAASICGTDLHIRNWDEWAQHRIHPPLTLGHEFAGTVEALGEGEVNLMFLQDGHRERLKPGARATVEVKGCAPATSIERVDAAVLKVLKQGYRTRDIHREGMKAVGTEEMGDLIAREVERSY